MRLKRAATWLPHPAHADTRALTALREVVLGARHGAQRGEARTLARPLTVSLLVAGPPRGLKPAVLTTAQAPARTAGGADEHESHIENKKTHREDAKAT